MRRAVLLAVLLALAAPGALAAGPRGAVEGGRVFLDEAHVAGWVAAQCPGSSPSRNTCGVPVETDWCALGCAPRVSGTLGFTGTVVAKLWGRNADGSDAAVWQTCSFAAGQAVRVGNAAVGGCSTGTNAREGCPGEADCVVLYPPYRLTGQASPFQGVPAAGPWNVLLVAN